MAVMNATLLQFEEAPIQHNDILVLEPHINGGHPSAIRPLENLRNHYYATFQAIPIARTNPPVKKETTPVTFVDGAGATYRLSDEALRQYSLGAYLTNAKMSYYQSRL